MTILRNALLATAALTLTASPALAEHHDVGTVAAAEQKSSEHDRLFALFTDADARNLALTPLSRLFRGDDSNDTRRGAYLTTAQFLSTRTTFQQNLALLEHIDRSKINTEERIDASVYSSRA